jgi:hypothetical protein
LSSSSRKAQSDRQNRQKEEPINCPENPYWVQEHQFLSWDFYENLEQSELKTNNINVCPTFSESDSSILSRVLIFKFVCHIDKTAFNQSHIDKTAFNVYVTFD